MFSSQILELAIGLVFLYFFLSLLCSVIIEMVTALTKKRPRMLKEGILSLLRDPEALNRLYEQPLFMGKTTPKNFLWSLWESVKSLMPWLEKVPVPSYISSRSFVLSLLESLKQHPDVIKNLALPVRAEQVSGFKDKLQKLPETSKIKKPLLDLFQVDDKATLDGIQRWFEGVKKDQTILPELIELMPALSDVATMKQLVAALPRNGDISEIRGALLPLLESVGTDIDKAFERMEKWYDEAMDRVTGWYRRYSQACALFLAFLVALTLNADTFGIGKALYLNPTLRAAMVTMAEDAVKKGAPEKMLAIEKTPPAAPQGTPEPGKTTTPPAPNAQTDKKVGGAGLASGSAAPASQSGSQEPGSTASGVSNNDVQKEIKRIAQMNDDIRKMEALNLPLGWVDWWKQWELKNKDKGYFCWIGSLFWEKLFGILFTALMVCLGSNFWFELLNKLVNMRNAGQKPLTKEEQEVKKP